MKYILTILLLASFTCFSQITKFNFNAKDKTFGGLWNNQQNGNRPWGLSWVSKADSCGFTGGDSVAMRFEVRKTDTIISLSRRSEIGWNTGSTLSSTIGWLEVSYKFLPWVGNDPRPDMIMQINDIEDLYAVDAGLVRTGDSISFWYQGIPDGVNGDKRTFLVCRAYAGDTVTIALRWKFANDGSGLIEVYKGGQRVLLTNGKNTLTNASLPDTYALTGNLGSALSDGTFVQNAYGKTGLYCSKYISGDPGLYDKRAVIIYGIRMATKDITPEQFYPAAVPRPAGGSYIGRIKATVLNQ